MSDIIYQGKRFKFGDNWHSFLTVASDERILFSESSLKTMLETDSLKGKSFLDVGCGSGLFSLAARRLGAKVHSFDYDKKCVECALKIKQKYFYGDDDWVIEQGDVLDAEYLKKIGKFDVVYSWGVLHHTGAMWQAFENVIINMENEGRLYIAIYNDQGIKSNMWRLIKFLYCFSIIGRFIILTVFIPLFIIAGLFKDILSLKNPLNRYREYKKKRGMSFIHDCIDWLGGYPFETAKPDEIIRFYEDRGMSRINVKTCGKRLGCNEFLFMKHS